jgi:Protein of unknown function (DUF2911)
MQRLFSVLALLALPAGTGAQSTDVFPPEIIYQEPGCKPQRPTANRSSPYDSVAFTLNGQRAVICYGRPSSRGRTMIGGTAVPYGKLWRTGANEPTTLHIPVAATIAGVQVQPGSYAIYTVPSEGDWEVIVNRSTSQWGHESRYTDEVKAQEVGRGKAKSSKLNDPIETFTIKSANAQRGADLVLEWEHTRVTIPIRAATDK